jgi:hypothetical protein
MLTRCEPITSQQLLLLFLACDGEAHSHDMTPLRIMVGMFLWSERTDISFSQNLPRYEFEPASYGPAAVGVYADIEWLAMKGWIDGEDVPARTWKRYKLTAAGQQEVDRIAWRVDPQALNFLLRIKRWSTRCSTLVTMRIIHERYPDACAKSLFFPKIMQQHAAAEETS